MWQLACCSWNSFCVKSLLNDETEISANVFLLERTGKMQKRAVSKHKRQCFPDRIWTKNRSSQHGLGAESPFCLVSRSQIACSCPKLSDYTRLAIYILPRRQKEMQHKRKGLRQITFITVLSIKSQTIAWIATIITITWEFYNSYSGWKLLTSGSMHFATSYL